MRVRKPQEFDSEREYKPGERAIYKGMDYYRDMNESQPEVEEKTNRYEITVDTIEIQGKAIEALMFAGSKVEIHRVEMPKRNPRDKRRGKNERNGKGGRNI